MRVRWTHRALRQLEETLAFIAEDNPIAAGQIAERIYIAERLLADNPTIGRTGRLAGTREWVVQGAPYLMGYTLNDHELVVLALLHREQQWPNYLA